jgi:hypothetical protein
VKNDIQPIGGSQCSFVAYGTMSCSDGKMFLQDILHKMVRYVLYYSLFALSPEGCAMYCIG